MAISKKELDELKKASGLSDEEFFVEKPRQQSLEPSPQTKQRTFEPRTQDRETKNTIDLINKGPVGAGGEASVFGQRTAFDILKALARGTLNLGQIPGSLQENVGQQTKGSEPFASSVGRGADIAQERLAPKDTSTQQFLKEGIDQAATEANLPSRKIDEEVFINPFGNQLEKIGETQRENVEKFVKNIEALQPSETLEQLRRTPFNELDPVEKFERVAVGAAEGFPLMATAIAVSAGTGVNIAGGLLFGAMESADVVNKIQSARDNKEIEGFLKDPTDSEAATIGLLTGISTAAVESLSIGTMLNKGRFGKAAVNAIKSIRKGKLKAPDVLSRAIASTITEATEENIQERLINIAEKIGVDNMTEIAEGTLEASLTGGLLGFFGGAGTSTLQSAVEKARIKGMTDEEIQFFRTTLGAVSLREAPNVQEAINKQLVGQGIDVGFMKKKKLVPEREELTEKEKELRDEVENFVNQHKTQQEFFGDMEQLPKGVIIDNQIKEAIEGLEETELQREIVLEKGLKGDPLTNDELRVLGTISSTLASLNARLQELNRQIPQQTGNQKKAAKIEKRQILDELKTIRSGERTQDQVQDLVEESQTLINRVREANRKQLDSIANAFLDPENKAEKINKAIIRKTTGQRDVSPKIVLTEKQALRQILKREKTAASRASREAARRIRTAFKFRNRINKIPKSTIEPEARQQLQAINERARKTVDVDELQDLSRQARAIKQESQRRVNATKAARKVHLDVAAAITVQTVNQFKKKPERETAEIVSSEKKISGRRAAASVIEVPRLMDDLDGGGRNFNRHMFQLFVAQPLEAERAEIRQRNNLTKTVSRLYDRFGIRPQDLNERIAVDNVIFTKSQIMELYATRKNTEAVLSVLFGGTVDSQGRNVKFPLSTYLKAIRKLSVKERQATREIMAVVDSLFPQLNDTFIAVNDGEKALLPVQEGYLPIERVGDFKPTMDEALESDMQARLFLRQKFPKGNTKPRKLKTPERQGPVRLGFHEKVTSYIKRTAHYINNRMVVKDLQNIIGRKEVKEAFRNNSKLGQEHLDIVQNYVNNIANPTGVQSDNALGRAADAVRANASIVFLGLNVKTIAKQVPSYMFMAPFVGVDNLLAASHDYITNKTEQDKFIHTKSPKMAERTVEVEIQRLQNADPQGFKRLVNVLGQGSLRGILFVDHQVTHAGWLGAYRKALKQGYSEEQAINFADAIVFSTQPTSDPKFKIDLLNQRGVVGAFGQFQTQTSKIFQMMGSDIPSFVSGGKPLAATGLGIAVLLDFLLITAISRGFDFPDEPEEALQEMAFNAMHTIPILGPTANGIRMGFTGLPPALQLFVGPVAEALKLPSRKGDPTDFVKSMVNLAGARFRLPTNATFNTFQGISSFFLDEDFNDKRVFLGVTPGTIKFFKDGKEGTKRLKRTLTQDSSLLGDVKENLTDALEEVAKDFGLSDPFSNSGLKRRVV